MKDANAEKSRLQWIDLFRGLAVLGMIETHVANTFLYPELLSADWFKWLNYTNGLVAPAFLFIAGVLQGKSKQRALPSSAPVGLRPFTTRLWRIGQLLLLGYMLHLPNSWSGEWVQAFSHIDILQCIGVAMLLGLFLQGRGRLAVGIVAGFFILAAPVMSQISPESMPVLAAGYVNRLNGSLFPLFPWAGFFFAGWFCQGFKVRECLIGVGLCWGAVWVQRFLPAMYPAHDYYLAGPGFFWERLGWMLVGVMCCQAALGETKLRALQIGRLAAVTQMIIKAGRASLAVYVIHLQLINALRGGAVWMGLPAKVGLLGMIALFLALSAVSLKLAGWLGLLRAARPYHWLGGRRASALALLP